MANKDHRGDRPGLAFEIPGGTEESETTRVGGGRIGRSSPGYLRSVRASRWRSGAPRCLRG